MTEARLLGGRYELGELLGYGGMAEVHRGRDQRLGRDVAIKVLRADLARDPGFQARFRREAQNAAALNHPAIVAVYDTGEERMTNSSLPYIVMEYVEGRTLKEVLTAEGRLMPERALEIVADVCAALDFSHRNDIVHRDIKPGNVMLTGAGAVKVMDFGIARAMTSATATMTQTSAVIGTAQYLSPEQARGETVDARSDVYSTGCLLYELLTGQPPFSGDNPVSVAYQHVREDPIPPGEIEPEVSGAMDAVVLKAMAKNPANRYQSAGEMRIDLLRAVAGRPVLAPAVMSAQERTQVMPGASREADPLPQDSYNNRERSGRKKIITWSLIVLALIAVFSATAFATSKLFDKTPPVSVPDVIGQNFTRAASQLEGKSFKVDIRRVKSSAEDKDKVVSQNPGANAKVDKGSTVKLEIGSGPDTVPVPNIDNLSRADAEQKLRDADLAPLFQSVNSSAKKDLVIDYNPGAGSEVEKGSTVQVKISLGNLSSVPSLVGKDVDTATKELQDAGLNVSVSEQETTAKPAGTVIAQSVKAGEEINRNTEVTITVAKAPVTPTSSSPSTSKSPTSSPSSPSSSLTGFPE